MLPPFLPQGLRVESRPEAKAGDGLVRKEVSRGGQGTSFRATKLDRREGERKVKTLLNSHCPQRPAINWTLRKLSQNSASQLPLLLHSALG